MEASTRDACMHDGRKALSDVSTYLRHTDSQDLHATHGHDLAWAAPATCEARAHCFCEALGCHFFLPRLLFGFLYYATTVLLFVIREENICAARSSDVLMFHFTKLAT